MRLACALVLVLVTPLLVQAQQPSQSPDVTSVLQQRYTEWMTAFRHRDGAAMDRMEASGLTLLFQDGTIWTKQRTRVEELKGAKPSPVTFKIERPMARVHGDIAILTGVQIDTIPKTGMTEPGLFTTVWKREGGDWKVWSAHWSDVPAKNK